jgi:hypothetical protein
MRKANRKTDRDALQQFCDAVDTRPVLLKPDEYNDWRLSGTHGHVYATPEAGAFYIYVAFRTSMGWTAAKDLLAFCTISQDGDDEGILRLERLPHGSREAKAIRQVVGLPKCSPNQTEAI